MSSFHVLHMLAPAEANAPVAAQSFRTAASFVLFELAVFAPQGSLSSFKTEDVS